MKGKALIVGLAALLLPVIACSSGGTSNTNSTSTTSTTTSTTTSPAPASTSAASPATNSAPATSPASNTSQSNPDLDFTLVNGTGYDIKEVYVGASGTGEWDKSDEVLKGRTFRNGDQLEIKFHPKAKAEKWDLMVAWADGTGKEQWLNLKLTEISKITLKYDKAADKTTAVVE